MNERFDQIRANSPLSLSRGSDYKSPIRRMQLQDGGAVPVLQVKLHSKPDFDPK